MARSLGVGVALLLGGYLLLTSTVTLYDTMFKFDVKRILELCLFPLIFAPVLFNRTLRITFRHQLERIPRWVNTVLLALLALGIVSSAYNATSGMALLYSLAEVLLLTLLVVAVLAVAACREVAGTAFDQVAIALITLVGLAVGVQELTGVFAALSLGLEFHPLIALLHFSWPRFYNQVQTWSIPIIAALPLVFPGRPLAKFLCVAALALEWYVVIATGARGAMVSVVAGLIMAGFYLPDIRKGLIKYQIFGLMIAVVIYGLVVLGHQQLAIKHSDDPLAKAVAAPQGEAEPGTANDAVSGPTMGESSGSFVEPLTGQRVVTSSGRIDMWIGTLQDARTHPLLGIGPMNYACTGPIYRAGHPHNFPLQFMDEWGIPAVILLLITVAALFFRLASVLRKPGAAFVRNAPLAGYFATGMLAAMILACLDGVLVMPASQVTGVLVCGCLLGLLPARPGFSQSGISQSSHSQRGNSQPTVTAAAVLTLAIIASIAFLAFARHELSVAEVRWTQTPVMDQGIPRLWQNGKVCALYQQAGIWDQSKNSPK